MLVIIDMQNHILDPNSEFYIPESDQSQVHNPV